MQCLHAVRTLALSLLAVGATPYLSVAQTPCRCDAFTLPRSHVSACFAVTFTITEEIKGICGDPEPGNECGAPSVNCSHSVDISVVRLGNTVEGCACDDAYFVWERTVDLGTPGLPNPYSNGTIGQQDGGQTDWSVNEQIPCATSYQYNLRSVVVCDEVSVTTLIGEIYGDCDVCHE